MARILAVGHEGRRVIWRAFIFQVVRNPREEAVDWGPNCVLATHGVNDFGCAIAANETGFQLAGLVAAFETLSKVSFVPTTSPLDRVDFVIEDQPFLGGVHLLVF